MSRTTDHPRIRSGKVAEEIATALAELLGHIDLHLNGAEDHGEMDPLAMERYPLFTSITWEPPSKDQVKVTEVGATFPFATLFGPSFTVVVMPTIVAETMEEARRARLESDDRFSGGVSGMGAS